MQIIPNIKVAYLAGYLEADGCIQFGQHKTSILELKVKAKSGDFLILQEFGKYFGGRVRPVTGGVNRQMFEWSVSGQQAQFVATCFLPYLIQKRRLANLALDCVFTPAKKLTEEEKTKRAVILKEAQEFNHRKTIGV